MESIKSRRAKATGPRAQAKAGSGQHVERAGLLGRLAWTAAAAHLPWLPLQGRRDRCKGARVHGQWAGPSTRSSDRSHVMLALLQEQPRAGNWTSQLSAMPARIHPQGTSGLDAHAGCAAVGPDGQTARLLDSQRQRGSVEAPCDATVKQQLRQCEPLYHPVDSSYPIAGGAALRSLSSSTHSPKVAQSDPAARGA